MNANRHGFFHYDELSRRLRESTQRTIIGSCFDQPASLAARFEESGRSSITWNQSKSFHSADFFYYADDQGQLTMPTDRLKFFQDLTAEHKKVVFANWKISRAAAA